MDLLDVTGATIERSGIRDHEFEEFVGRLIRDERHRRHPSAKVRGPTKDKKADGGRDITVEVTKPALPGKTRDEQSPSLIWDEPGITWYSCKSGHTWHQNVLSELGRAACNRAQRGTPPPEKLRNRLRELVEHVSRGGRYVVVVSERSEPGKLLDQIADLLRFWLEDQQLVVPVELRRQLDFIDANDLAEYIQVHRPNLSSELREKLGTADPPGLLTWEQWTEVHFGGDRQLTKFESDAARDRFLARADDPSARVLRVFGAPGAGKSRLVHEALGRLGLEAQQRVRYCSDVERAREAFAGQWLYRTSDILLVLDELQTTDVDSFVPIFEAAHKRTGGRLFLIGTSDGDDARGRGRTELFHLDRLDEPASRRLIARELGHGSGDTDEVGAIHRLSEGYPLFAVLLARSLAEDRASLERGTDETSSWLATLRVLAGSQSEYGSPQEWERTGELRAKCLLVVLLTHGLELSWDDLWNEHSERLALALDEPSEWQRVKKAERDCRRREILRYSGEAKRRYVSPSNLARIVLNHFLSGPDGPDLDPRLRRHVPELHAKLYAMGRSLGIATQTMDRLARGEWDELRRRLDAGEPPWEDGCRSAPALLEAAWQAPELAAWKAVDAVERLGTNALGPLLPVLRHLVHRKITPEAFEAVEATLFRVEPTSVGEWKRTWSSLFLVGLSETHQPWEHRFLILERRARSLVVEQRRLAVSAFDRLVDPDEWGEGVGDQDLRDGEWSQPSDDEYLACKQQLWALLVHACGDADSETAAKAREIATKKLGRVMARGFLATGLDELACMVAIWSPEERRRLVEVVLDLRHRRTEAWGIPLSLLDTLDALLAELAPRSFQERLIDQVGTWYPGPWAMDHAERERFEAAGDLELVAEALAKPELLAQQLEWLASAAAVRGTTFMLALGRSDEQRVFLEPLERAARAEGSSLLLAAYVRGWAMVDATTVEWWLAEQLEDATLGTTLAEIIAGLAPSVRHLGWLRELAIEEQISLQALRSLSRSQWLAETSAKDMLDLVHEVARRPGYAAVVLQIGAMLLDHSVDPNEDLLELVARCAREALADDRVPIVHQPAWRRVVYALAEAGWIGMVADLLLSALDPETDGFNMSLARFTLQGLLEHIDARLLWEHLAPRLLEHRRRYLVIEELAAHGLVERLGLPFVLEWVGQDELRATLAVHMVRLGGPALDPLARALLQRFGSGSPVVFALHRMVRELGGGALLADRYREQRELVRAWGQDLDPAVRSWAQGLEVALTRAIDEEEARAELRRRYG
jgi:hypothetical protein